MKVIRKQRLHLRTTGIVAVMWVLAASGCSGPANEYDSIVTGTVTIDGDLAESGTVTFHPVDKGLPAIGRIYPDGTYSLRTGQGDLGESDGGTVIPGEYVVTVSINAPPVEKPLEGGPPSSGPTLIDFKYVSKETSDLRHTVKPGKNVIVLELEGAKPETPAEETGTRGEERGARSEEGAESEPLSTDTPPQPAAPPQAVPPQEGAPGETPAETIPE